MEIETAVGRAILGLDSEETFIARTVVHAAVTGRMFCRVCGSILDNRTAQVVEIEGLGSTVYCHRHKTKPHLLATLADEHGRAVSHYTWNSSTTTQPKNNG